MSVPQRTARGPHGARVNLSAFVRNKAATVAEEVRFGWIGVPNAPATSQQLRGAYARSQRTGDPLPVSNQYCDDTIYAEPSDNVCYRFWHDVTHVQLGLSFGLDDELELAIHHLDVLHAAGFPRGSLESDLLKTDLLGQIYLVGIAGRFPFNQGEFTRTCIELGLEAGLLHEIRKVAQP